MQEEKRKACDSQGTNSNPRAHSSFENRNTTQTINIHPSITTISPGETGNIRQSVFRNTPETVHFELEADSERENKNQEVKNSQANSGGYSLKTISFR